MTTLDERKTGLESTTFFLETGALPNELFPR